jgi:hypothetical protein
MSLIYIRPSQRLWWICAWLPKGHDLKALAKNGETPNMCDHCLIIQAISLVLFGLSVYRGLCVVEKCQFFYKGSRDLNLYPIDTTKRPNWASLHHSDISLQRRPIWASPS